MVRTHTYKHLVVICLLCDDDAIVVNCIPFSDSLIYHAHILFDFFSRFVSIITGRLCSTAVGAIPLLM
jgi:hypothetical protein